MKTSASKTAVISGGSSGIGRAMVAQLHREGWQVHTCGRDESKLRQLERDFPSIKAYTCDVADRIVVQRFADAVHAVSPRIDLLISNAGGLRDIDFTRDDLRGVDLTSELRVNTEGALHYSRARRSRNRR